MKLSILPVTYFKDICSKRMSIGDWAREGIKLGLDGIDISILFLEDRNENYLRKFRNELEDVGIPIVAASTYPDFTHPENDIREMQQKRIKEDIQALAEVGTRIIRITAGQAHPGINEEDGIKWALDGLLCAEETAIKCGVQLVFENHAKPGVWEYYDFDYPTHIFLRIADCLKDSRIKILFDCANPIAYGDDPMEILPKVIEEVECIHASDTSTRGNLTPTIIGEGLVPYKKIFSFLKKNKYDGWISIEEASGQGEKGMEKAVKFIRNTWNTVK